MRPCLKKSLCKKGLVEGLKVKALSSSPSTIKTTTTKLLRTICRILPFS
jgi:hypothetical protein